MLERAPSNFNPEGEKVVLNFIVLQELCKKVLKSQEESPREDPLELIHRVVRQSSKVPLKDRRLANEEVSAELLRQKNEALQAKVDAKHDRHWTVRAGLDD